MKSAHIVALRVEAEKRAADGRMVGSRKRAKLRNEAKRLLWLNKIRFWVRKTKPKKPRGREGEHGSPVCAERNTLRGRPRKTWHTPGSEESARGLRKAVFDSKMRD
jgi:hypothetical protein